MGTLYGSPAYVEVFFRVAEEYGIPANAIDLSDSVVVAKFIEQGYPIDENVIGIIGEYSLPKLDNFTSAPNGETYEEKIENFKTLIKGLPSGLTEEESFWFSPKNWNGDETPASEIDEKGHVIYQWSYSNGHRTWSEGGLADVRQRHSYG